MRITELTDQQKDSLILKCVSRFMEYHRITRWTQKEIALYLAAAGLCAGGALWAVTLARGQGLAFAASIPWHTWLIVFGVVGISLFVIAWFKFMAHEVTMRAGERVFLVLVFEKCANENIEFSGEEIVAFLKFVPDSMTVTEGMLRRSRTGKTHG